MKKWILRSQPGDKYRKKFSNYSKFVQTIFYQIGIKTDKEAEDFFGLDYENGLHDPQLLSGMEKGAERILKAIKNNEQIAIYGDYDADGVTATAVLSQFFKELKIEPVVYIPERVNEGYGLNGKAIDYLKDKKVKLVITVDTGIRNVEEAQLFKEEGIDLIITDHHSLPEKLPEAVAVINPHQDKGKYPFEDLAGVGVAFKLVQFLIGKIGENKFSAGFEKWLLDLVALGTIADMVPLKGENRILAKYGLIVLSKTKRFGLRSLMSNTRISLNDEQPITSETVAFQIAPRINAAGRMDHANNALVLLNAENNTEAKKLADQLEDQNKARRNITSKILRETEKMDFGDKKIIIVGKDSWPLGVIGLAAGKLCDKFNRPVLVYGKDGNQVRGSARSIVGFNIIKALDELDDLLVAHGGHKQAAGFTVPREKLSEFKERLEKIAEQEIQTKDLMAKQKINYRINFNEIGKDLEEELKAFEPYGVGNQEPVFLIKDAQVCQAKFVGKTQKHLKLLVCEGKKKAGLIKYIGCIGFNFENYTGKIKPGDLIDIVFNLSVNNFNGKAALEFKMIDLRVKS
ncbi:MAG: single-stranded-DNA-specific exonuclease RecJ [Patescibacteria group bacterium]|nr:single-stranded-DNA-specific exonuclease RecJ [Patescibacteria group bacterium]